MENEFFDHFECCELCVGEEKQNSHSGDDCIRSTALSRDRFDRHEMELPSHTYREFLQFLFALVWFQIILLILKGHDLAIGNPLAYMYPN